MTVENEITKRFPSNGALPAEQTAAAAQHSSKEVSGNAGMTESDKQIYKLVENNVGYAGKEFGKNLKVNSEVLSNVLYDNIFKLLSKKFNEDEFVEALSDKLLSDGYITDDKQNVVNSLDADDQEELNTKIAAAVELIQANKPTLFKLFSSDDAQVESKKPSKKESDASSNIVISNKQSDEIDKVVSDFEKSVENAKKASIANLDICKSIIKTIGSRTQHGLTAFNNSKKSASMKTLTAGVSHGMQSINRKIGGDKKKVKPASSGLKKQGNSIESIKKKLKLQMANSMLGKIHSTIGKTVKTIVNMVSGAVNFVKKTIQVAWKATKMVGKAFWGASKLVGKGLKAVGTGIVKVVKGLTNAIKTKNLGAFMAKMNPATMVTKLGWRAIKWGARKLWGGLKKLAFKAASFFKSLFKLGGKFVNNAKVWIDHIGRGVEDKAYTFLIKPIADILVSVFDFVQTALMSPVGFLKHLIPSVFDKVRTTMFYINQGVRDLWKSTWGIFKKILFNPLTLALIIGGIFLLFRKTLMGWLSQGLGEIQSTILSAITTISTESITFFKELWDFSVTLIRVLWPLVKYITDPDNFIWKAVKSVWKVWNTIKSEIGRAMKVAGKDSVDVFCSFLAGDMIGIWIHTAIGNMIKFWRWLKKQTFFRIVFGLIKAITKLHWMILKLPIVLLESLAKAAWSAVKLDFGEIVNSFCKPWREWWNELTSIFGDEPEFNADMVASREYMDVDPTELNLEQRKKVRIAIRSLAGKTENIEFAEKVAQTRAHGAVGNLFERLKSMTSLWETNSSQVEHYGKFLEKIWEVAGNNDGLAQHMLKTLLESAELSEKLLSAFFYYNPQTGDTMILRPPEYIDQFLVNIREMVNDPDRDNKQALKTLVEAFDQLNKERSNIINKQGDVIVKFAESIQKLNTDEEDMTVSGQKELREQIKKFNKGDLFDSIDIRASFLQMADNDAQSQYLQSVTGDTLDTNKLNKVEFPTKAGAGGTVILPKLSFRVKPREGNPKENVIDDQIILPAEMNPAPMIDPRQALDPNGQNLLKKYNEYVTARANLLTQGKTEKEVIDLGYGPKSFGQFKEDYYEKNPISPETLLQWEKNKASRLAALRLARDIQAYHSQGKIARLSGFEMGKTPSILQVTDQGLKSTLYMFSPEWKRICGASKLTDAQLKQELGEYDAEYYARVRKMEEEKEAKKRAEEERKRREDAILNFSAKVVGDVIEIKLGEDVVAMERAWHVHLAERDKGIAMHLTEEQLEKAGLKYYSWPEWKKYYRKMKGLPEDGIKRVPFNGKRKPRNITWYSRDILSPEEMKKYGIEFGVSSVNIDKALAAASDLFKEAKTVHSIRDGLEVLSRGVRSAELRLKIKREKGYPVVQMQQKPEVPSIIQTISKPRGSGPDF